MNNKRTIGFLVALGVLLLVVGLFANTGDEGQNNGIQGQTINSPGNTNGMGMNNGELLTNDQNMNMNNNRGNTSLGTQTTTANIDMQQSRSLCDSLEADDRYSDVKALVMGNNAMVSCQFNNSADINTMKSGLIQKVKEINPNITDVKIVETQTASNTFNQMFNDFMNNTANVGNNLADQFTNLFNMNNATNR